jgi:hypothetical protein
MDTFVAPLDAIPVPTIEDGVAHERVDRVLGIIAANIPKHACVLFSVQL